MGTVTFSKVTFEHFGNMSPNGRIAAESEWKHIFAESATLLITNKATGQEYTLEYDPNDFTEAYQIQLPFGEYSVFSEVEGGDFETFLPFTISGEFTLDETSLDISLQGSTEYGLVTVKKEFVQSANLDGAHELVICDQGKILYLYVKAGLSPTLTIYENFNGQALQKELAISAYNHYHFFLKLTESQGTVNFIELAIGPFEYHEEYFEIGGKNNDGTVTDADGNVYGVVKIGEQYWLAENLRATTYCDGTPLETHILPLYTYVITLGFNEQPDYALVKDDYFTSENIYYYSREVVMNEKNICPCNWHVSTEEDWIKLLRYINVPDEDLNMNVSGNDQKVADKLMAMDWPNSNGHLHPEVNITNSTGFTAYPHGYFRYESDESGEGLFRGHPQQAWWWSSKNDSLFTRMIQPLNSRTYPSAIHKSFNSERYWHEIVVNIRCVKD
ncbi:hypothetical protein GCM10011339_45060 [Echinicola rosea]|uniref:Fibrobacter succinogenes major paralogous domain-containing protein n=2 Tax=Echinicola rosea TaxID=1807691 RepID=A0ABQ1VBD4_9BACT|nr:hypothetical protein GCM10011339_45060 [Echinicola rosea]